MAGERSVRISFEAREELSRAIAQIDTALDGLDEGLKESAANLTLTDQAAERLEGSLDEISDEATEAMISLSGLQSQLAGLEATSGTRGVQIPIDIDDPSDASLEEIRTKVAAKLRESPGEFDIGADIDVEELAEEIEKADAWINQHTKPGAQRPLADIGVDLDESSMVKELQKAQREAEEAAGNIEMDAEIPSSETAEVAEDVNAATEQIESSAGKIALGFSGPSQGQIFSAVGRVSQAINEIEETAGKIDLKFGGPSQGQIFSAGGRVAAATQEIEGMAGDIDVKIDVDASDDIMELAALVSSMSAVQAQAMATAASTRTAASGIDEVGDEAAESATEMGVFASVASLMSLNMTALSLNVGMFNIALSNLATQIPILLASLGTLATALIGIGGAAVIAATGIAGIVAGGVLSEISRVEEEFSNIEDSAQALQAIMRSLADAFREAFAPLTELEGSGQAFFDLVNGMLTTVNAFAKGIADSFRFSAQEMQNFVEVGRSLGIISDEMSDSEIDAQIMSLGEFMDELGRIWMENVDDIVRGVKVMSAFLLPVLADIIEFFIAGFDDMAVFVTQFTSELATVGPALVGILTFATELINLGSTILQGLMPVFVGLISVATGIANALNQVNPQIIRNVAGMLLLGKVVSSLVGAYTALSSAIGVVIAGTQLEVLWKGILANKNAVLAGRIGLVTAARRIGNLVRSSALGLIQSITGAQIVQNTVLSSAIARIWAYVSAASALILANSTLAATIWGAVTGLWGMASAALASGIAFIASYIPGVAAGTIATGSLTAAVMSLHAATGGLTLLIAGLAAALIALLGAGALAVGTMANMESVTSGLGSVLAGIKSAFSDLVNVLLGSFISVWNSLIIGFQGFMAIWDSIAGGFDSIAQALGFAGSQGSLLGGIWDMLMVATDLLLMPFEILYRIIGQVAFVIGGVLAAAIDIIVGAIVLTINIIKALIGAFAGVVDWILKFIGISGGISAVVDGITGAINTLIDALLSIPQVAGSIFNMFVGMVEGIVNEVIGAINGIIRALPKEVRSTLGVSTFDEVSLQGPSSEGQITREDVIEEDTDSAEDEVTARQGNNFNYNEENINNVSQEINADPEDKEGLRRIVKDAIEEANAFNRRNQGHGG